MPKVNPKSVNGTGSSKGASNAKFITFEGGEGVGKSTQVKQLLTRLGHCSISAVCTREPGGTPKAEAIRSFILGGSSQSWGVGAEAVLFAAARLDHVTKLVAPNLESGNWVISDRFHDSTRAYQGLTGGVEPKLIDALEELALNGYEPELTIMMDMDPKTAFERVEQRAIASGIPVAADRFESEDLDWHQRLRDGFLQIAKNNPQRCFVVDAAGDELDIAEEIWDVVTKQFPELNKKIDP
ncbi:Thymidylate kinase [hydrothermal vent metagenome]|uniref:dTMP kinase n=1 Tax=hydrothermal vent metagenome TaxID=652676 RepID=A0A3B0U4H4_9ZZZZ